MVSITGVADDEPNRRILITVRNDATGQIGDINAAPGDTFKRHGVRYSSQTGAAFSEVKGHMVFEDN